MWKIISFAVALGAVFIVIQAQDFCLICDSSPTYPECIDPSEALDFKGACGASSRNRSCFSRVDGNGNVVRGCLGSLDNSTAANCDSETCKICFGDSCNDRLFPPHRLSCHICAGGVNSTCGGRANTTMTVCPKFQADDQCYIARPNGNFERGCLSSAAGRCDGNDAVCLVCAGPGCNFEDYSSAVNVHSSTKMISFALVSILLAIYSR